MAVPTPERAAADRLLRLERDVLRLQQQLSDRRAALDTADQPLRLAVTVLEVNPDYDPETEEGPENRKTLDYPDPPATVFPIRFLDAVNNDPDRAEADQDFDRLDRGQVFTEVPESDPLEYEAAEFSPPQAYAMHIRGEYVGPGTVIAVLLQRPVQGPAEDALDDRVQWWIHHAIDGAVAVRNKYESAIPPYGLIRLRKPIEGEGEDPDEESEQHGGVIYGDRPAAAEDPIYVVNDRYEIPAGEIGLAWEDERLHVFKTVSSPAELPKFGHIWAPKNDEFGCDKNDAGDARIQVFKDLGDGLLWGRFRQAADQTIPFRNESTYEVPAYGVMRVVGYDATLKEFRTERPHADHFHSLYLINGSTPVPGATGDPLEYSSGTGRFQSTTGLIIACDSGTPAYGQCWGPQPDSFLLRQHAEGFFVTRADETGLLKAFPYEVFSAFGKVPSTISKGSTGTVDVYYGTGGSEADSGFRITCRAKFNAITSTAKFVEIKRWNGQWYVGPLEC